MVKIDESVPKVRISNPATMHKPTGYSHVAEVTGGRFVFISGQVSLDPNGEVVGRDDYTAQAKQIFENLKLALDAAGGKLKDIIKLNYYCVDISHMPEIRAVRNTYLDQENFPVSTAVEVRRLVRPEFLLEIEAMAVIQ